MAADLAPAAPATTAPGRRGWRPGASATVLPGVVVFALFVLVPFGLLAFYSLLTSGTFVASQPLTIDAYRRAIESPLTGEFALNALRIGLPTALLTIALALPVACWLRYSARRMLAPVLFLVTATIFASYLVRVYAWRTMLGDQGVVNGVLEGIGVTDEPLGFLLFNRFSVTLGLTHWLLPLAVLMLYGAFRPLEAGYIEAARDLGARTVGVWRRVVLPAIAAPLATTFLLMFVIASSDWLTPLLLGGGKDPTLGQRIQEEFKQLGDYPAGAALSLLMLVAFALLYAVLALGLRGARLDKLHWTDAAPGAPRPSRPAGIATGVVLAFLYVPLLVVVLFSFHSTPSLSLPFEGFSLRWYEQLFADEVAVTTLRTSLLVASVTALISLVLGTLTAYGLTRARRRLHGPLRVLFLLPLALPPLFVGLALFTLFVELGVQLSLQTVVIAHVVVTLPLFVLIAGATLDRLDPALDDAAQDLGAGGWQTFRHVTLPQVWPALVAGAALAFALSFDEFPVTFFVMGEDSTLPFYVYGRLRQTIDPLINAISTLLMTVMFLLFALATLVEWLNARRRGSRATEL